MPNDPKLSPKAAEAEERLRKLLRLEILGRFRSLRQCDEALGLRPNTTSQLLRGRPRLTSGMLLHYITGLEIDGPELIAGALGIQLRLRRAASLDVLRQTLVAGEMAAEILRQEGELDPLPRWRLR
jgi:hypothetical protein